MMQVKFPDRLNPKGDNGDKVQEEGNLLPAGQLSPL